MNVMLDRTFWHHVMLDTEEELRAEAEDTTRPADEHDALVDALHQREDAHVAAEHLAVDHDNWTEVHSHTAVQVEMEPTGAAAPMSLAELLSA